MVQGNAVLSVRSSVEPSGEAFTVFVVGEDKSLRESLESLIAGAGWQPKAFASAKQFLAYPRLLAPSCLVLDDALADLSGLELQKRLADRTEMPIIFVTGLRDIPMTVQVMKAGAVELLTKPFGDAELLDGIRLALHRSRQALAQQAQAQILRDRYASLSRRERQVMALTVAGLLNKQIGCELEISEITVKAHRGKVMRKMRASSLAELVRIELSLQRISGVELLLPEAIAHRSTAAQVGANSWRPRDIRSHLVLQVA
jgi:FixJ family two-component response regulator